MYSNKVATRSSFMKTNIPLVYGKSYNNCSNTLCYTYSKGTTVYAPHSAKGMVGTPSSSARARRTQV